MGKLTVLQVKALTEPGRYPDGDGLFLLVGVTGTKSWMLRIQVDGRRRDLGLGSLDRRTLAQARDAAIDLRRKCQTEGFPDHALSARYQALAARSYFTKDRLKIPTFREAAIAVHDERKASWKNGNHQEQWLVSLEKYVFPS